MSAIIADSIGNIEREVVTSLLGCHLQQVQVLLLREVLVQVHVQGRSTRQVLDIRTAVKLEFLSFL